MIIEIELGEHRIRVTGENVTVAVVNEKSGELVTGYRPDAFPLPGHIVKLANQYAGYHGIAVSSLSTEIFNDGKRIERLRFGLGVTVKSYNDALIWFSKNWPAVMVWPHDVPRPEAAEMEKAS
jgi:hypothetical protein